MGLLGRFGNPRSYWEELDGSRGQLCNPRGPKGLLELLGDKLGVAVKAKPAAPNNSSNERLSCKISVWYTVLMFHEPLSLIS